MRNPLPENRLLASLPPAELARLLPRMADVTFQHKEDAYRSGGRIDYVYFPRASFLSAVVETGDGATAEVGLLGEDGMLGVTTALGGSRSVEHVYCQLAPAPCRRMLAEEFAAEAGRAGPLRDTVHRYARGSMAATSRLAACNCLHSSEERCARWLLQCHDRAGEDEFPLTHEFLAIMLGVRRARVTVTAGSLQTAGFISYKGGRVKVRDRAGLEDSSCECYRAMRDALAGG